MSSVPALVDCADGLVGAFSDVTASSESAANPPGPQRKGGRQNRPETAFVAELLAPAPRVAPTAVVYDRTGGVEICDGIARPAPFGGALRPELAAQKLRTGAVAASPRRRAEREPTWDPKADFMSDDACIAAWAAFQARSGR